MPESHPHAEWSGKIFDLMREAGVKLFAHVPDAGNDRLIALRRSSAIHAQSCWQRKKKVLRFAPVRTSLANALSYVCSQAASAIALIISH